VNYRLWLQNGEMTQQQAQALRTAFASPPSPSVKEAGKYPVHYVQFRG